MNLTNATTAAFAACIIGAGLSARAAGPYPASDLIADVTFDWGTHDERAPGSDNWPVTWADDGHQYAAWGDGGGFGGTNTDGRVSLGVARVEGAWDSYAGHNVWGGKNPENPAQFDGKSYGLICISGVLYMWWGPGSNTTSYTETRLCESADHGAHWTQSTWNLADTDGALIMPTVCQFGQDYAGARDGYVYHYFIRKQGSPSSLDVHKPGQIDLARVPGNEMMTLSAYEWFSGMSGGDPTWSVNAADRQPVFEDPEGVGWCMSVSHNAGLGRYVLCTEHTASFEGNLGMFDAPEPWGPWTTVKYYSRWRGSPSDTVPGSRGFYWDFSGKWLSADGKDFTLVFTGVGGDDSWNTVRGNFTVSGGGENGGDGGGCGGGGAALAALLLFALRRRGSQPRRASPP